MITIGISGGLDEPGRALFQLNGTGLSHDAAAILVKDGVVVAGVEQERIDRIKHSNHVPLDAIARCLRIGNCGIGDVEKIAVYLEEGEMNRQIAEIYKARRSEPGFTKRCQPLLDAGGRLSARRVLGRLLQSRFGCDVEEKLTFIRHHLCHAYSAIVGCGFSEGLVLVLDNKGEKGTSGMVATFSDGEISPLREFLPRQSLGKFYLQGVRLIGFDVFEEYKVMGLAPYGNRSRFQDWFAGVIEFPKDGDYRINFAKFDELAWTAVQRRRGDPIGQIQMDFAAGLQAALEDVVQKIAQHWSGATGLDNLCMAGGVAQNCSVNGVMLRSGVFKRIFVQPASSDSGCALGAAFAVQPVEARRRPQQRMSMFLGEHIGSELAIGASLRQWTVLVDAEPLVDPHATAAGLLADGKVIGWVQGRAEFGPRALGNRSILADPRPAANKDRVNAAVKKREAFRPFAPSVLSEHYGQYFSTSAEEQGELSFMIFVVNVLSEWRDVLGAVTHVDGTARVQVVERAMNEDYWKLINEFYKITGMPVVLNTSFNNNCEPIVDSVDDSVGCLLTTGLDCLVIGSYLVTKRLDWEDQLLRCRFLLPRDARMFEEVGCDRIFWFVSRDDGPREPFEISARAYAALRLMNTSDGLGRSLASAAGGNDVRSEILALWERRMVFIMPAND